MNKKITFFLLIFLTNFCMVEDDAVQPKEITTVANNDPVVMRDITVSDKNENFLGYLVYTEVLAHRLDLISSTGYLYSIKWDGSAGEQYTVFYDGKNCVGTAHLGSEETGLYNKVINQIGEKLFTPKLKNGEINYIIIDVQSKLNNASCTNFEYSNVELIEAIEISYEDAGIPEKIIPPITLTVE